MTIYKMQRELGIIVFHLFLENHKLYRSMSTIYINNKKGKKWPVNFIAFASSIRMKKLQFTKYIVTFYWLFTFLCIAMLKMYSYSFIILKVKK